MAPSIFNPLYLLVPPVILLFSIPLGIFAAITTTLAIGTLLIRVSIVYFDLLLALIRSYIFEKTKAPTPQPSPPHRHRSRRGSNFSSSSSQDFTVLGKNGPSKSASFASLLGAGAPGSTRDFEGIGGWRETAVNPGEEASWINMNSRLELPAPTVERRRHQRSLTGGSQRWSGHWSPEAVRLSPAQSRARTPSITELKMSEGGDGYFPLQLSGSMEAFKITRTDGRVKSSGGGTEDKKKRNTTGQYGDGRRKSSSGSSFSSQSSGKTSKGTNIKQTSYGT
ncbi:hypothetical protein BLS_005389 [Venturia inaequalis]|uniref:Uncharacterized protein n=1 Tax=Venturia inaequalis TaxID=5025 RepID=A0A8H3UHB4_VENIN|nr:hypothetical protein BLS_005389 [Venturia inaequalis]KAE9972510.1 hypothetical protein EG328_004936 [Venturia inaequalis]KAE9991227.1 hypothetical protein EG327_000282 [Venturia inaequalis]RDI77127.1 hypothetical protein Vi05172_g12863 [Venturia inaequalis]